MNITEALNVALPELPAQAVKERRPPRINPRLIAREQLEDGKLVVNVLVPELHNYYSFPPEQWRLLQLFDGERSYQEIADRYSEQTGTLYPEEWIRDFAEGSREAHYWYHSPVEKNLVLFEKLKEERRGRVKRKSKWGDLSEITFPAWDPDSFLTWLHGKVKFIFSWWFMLLNLGMFAFTAYIFVGHWNEIAGDTIKFYRFYDRGFWEIVEFWLLLLAISFVHEVSHGLGCKHAGGESHRMGFLLIYLSPAVFCETTEAWVYGGKWARIVTVAAGIWSTLIICSVASFVWWATPAGVPAHDFAYLIMLVGGLLPVAINLNPLIKLDGYFLFTELIGMSSLKENSTLFVMNWVKKNVFGLPVEVPYVTFRRKLLYVPYTILSEVYSYTLLYFVVGFVYNIARSYTPEWAFVPAAWVAWAVFKGRIKSFGRFMKVAYLDKEDRLRALFTPGRRIAFAVAVLLLLFVPFWPETVLGRFILEPVRRVVVRTEVPGTVVDAAAREGDRVQAGTIILRLRNLALESTAARARSDYQIARARSTEAQLKFADYQAAALEQARLAERSRTLEDELQHLTLTAPISGTVLTRHVHDLLGSYLQAGSDVAEIADLSTMRARIYVPETEVPKLARHRPAALHLDGVAAVVREPVEFIAPTNSELEAGLVQQQQYESANKAGYYVVNAILANDKRAWREGATGSAKIFVRRRSLAAFAGQIVYDFLRRKLW